MIGGIARREFGSLFRSPLAWVVLAVVQALAAFLFLLHLESYLDLQPRLQTLPEATGVTGFLLPRVYGAASVLLLMAVPLLTMNAIAGEWRQRTLPLLMSAPVSTAEIILGKFLGLMGLLAVMVVLITAMPLSLAFVTRIDTGALVLAAGGTLLFTAAATAAGLYLSTLTRQPIIAAVGTLGLLLVLLLAAEWGGQRGELPGGILAWPAPTTHLQPFLVGLFDTRALIHLLVFTGLFLALSVRRLDNDRLQR